MLKKIFSKKNNEKEIESWRIFKIMGEFVSGFEFIRKYDRAISFFGSARCTEDTKMYNEARGLAYKLAKKGFTILTGGGPGIMEAANRGANEAGGKSVGINIFLNGNAKTELRNKYVQESKQFDYFFVRKIMLSFASQIYVFFPGGFGTLDELFELITLVQTKKIPQIPIIIVGYDHWKPLIDWIEKSLCAQHNYVTKDDMMLYYLAKDDKEAFKIIQKLAPNAFKNKRYRL